MIYYTIDKDNKAFYIGEDKSLAIQAKIDNPTATFIKRSVKPIHRFCVDGM